MSAFFHLFERFGVELEYMIVDRDSLDVRPIADEVLHAVAGAYESEVEINGLAWSNELVLHVIELKTNGPASALEGLADQFQTDVRRINDIVASHHSRLMPTAMHPWMDPFKETRLWPHENCRIYETFNRVFDCRGHGWSNLQCTHINLPFADDEEFGRLHAAIRLLLPILPALAASSPMIDGRLTGLADTRLDVYRTNCRRIPSVSGRVIPEPVFTRSAYAEQILQRMYRDIAPFDPDGIVQYEWLNARGAIARFDRQTIEIRLLDIQECPRADLAVVMLVVRVLRALVDELWCSYERQRDIGVETLEPVLFDTIRTADLAPLANRQYLSTFGFSQATPPTAGTLWRHLFESLCTAPERSSATFAPINAILDEGSLAHRIAAALGSDPDRAQVAAVYRELCDCLAEGRMFHAAHR